MHISLSTEARNNKKTASRIFSRHTDIGTNPRLINIVKVLLLNTISPAHTIIAPLGLECAMGESQSQSG